MPTIQEQIVIDWKQALKDKNPAKSVLSLMNTEIKNYAINNRVTGSSGSNLADIDSIKVLKKMAKQRKESIEMFKNASRDELANKEQFELDIIQKYLPALMSSDEIETIVKKTILDLGANSLKDMGKVIGKVLSTIGAQADGKEVQKIVRNLLQA